MKGTATPLPPRDGVSASCVGLPAGPWLTITDFLCERFAAVPRDTWMRRMRSGDVLDESGAIVTPERAYQPHVRVYYYREVDDEPRLPFEEHVLYQDETLLAVDKPHFLPVTPTGPYLHDTLLVRLRRKLGLPDLAPLHRLDRETAGVMLFCIQPQWRAAYSALFAKREVHKVYEAVAPWQSALEQPRSYASRLVQSPDNFMQVVEVPGAPNAHTRIEMLAHAGELARYRLYPSTGKRHQLRVQCATLGAPILNDLIYPKLAPLGSDRHDAPLQLLARSLAFRDPLDQRWREFETRLELKAWSAASPQPSIKV